MRLTDEQVEQAKELAAAGVTYATIAERMGVSVSGVRYRLGRRWPEKPVPRRLTASEIAAIRGLRLKGVPIADVAAQFGVSTTTVEAHTSRHVTEPDARALTAEELLLSAFPWGVYLPPAERAEFARELKSGHRSEHATDVLIRSWRAAATTRGAS